jgi:hypothetical protein
MPGSNTAASVLADSALETLRRAYDDRQTQDVGDLILSAQESIANLKKAIFKSSGYGDLLGDSYELSETNSAI